jgi:2-hydroxy-3-oxopropionate reductase
MFKEGLIGFIGLGIMGKPMARNLMKAGYKLLVCDVVKDSVEQLKADGAESAATAEEVARRCNGLIITMLPNSPHVKEVVCGKNGILAGASKDTIIADMSSISPIIAQEVCEESAKKGVVYLDCPVSGGEPKAVEGTLAIMAGGDGKAFEAVREILLKMGSTAILVGSSGSGNVTKLANQIIVALNIAAISEALTLATKAGVDPEKVYQAIRGGLAGSTVLDAKAPMMLNGNFKPGFRIELHIKDLCNTLETAEKIHSPVPLSEKVLEFFKELASEGHEKEDHSGLLQYYENLAGIKVRKA